MIFIMYFESELRDELIKAGVDPLVIDQIVLLGNPEDNSIVSMISVGKDIAPGGDSVVVTRDASDAHTISVGGGRAISIAAKVPPRNPEVIIPIA